MLLAFAEAYKKYENFDFPPLHDPTTVCYVINPDLFQGQSYILNCEHKCEIKKGKLLFQRRVEATNHPGEWK